MSPRLRSLLAGRRVSRTGQPAAVCPPSVAAEQEHPRLDVWREAPGYWSWLISAPAGDILDSGTHVTHAEALAVGLAALEVASLTA